MNLVYLQGVLMNNNEFICSGRTIILAEDEIKKYVREVGTSKEELLVMLMDFKMALQDGSVETDTEIKEFLEECLK